MDVLIRSEKSTDIEAIERVAAAAFEGKRRSDPADEKIKFHKAFYGAI